MMQRLRGNTRYPFLIIILVLGATLRFWNLGKTNFWADEDMSVATQYRSVSEIIDERVRRSPLINIEPPGYHILNKAAQWIVPTPIDAFEGRWGRFGLRLLSAFAGIFSVFFMFQLAASFCGREKAWAPAALMSCSFYAVYYSQENRPYSLVAALTLLSTWLFVEAFFKGRRALAAPYAISIAALCYMHYTAILAPLIHLTAFVAVWVLKADMPEDDLSIRRIEKRDVMAFGLAGLGALILFAPWLQHTFSISVNPADYFSSARTTAETFPYLNFNLSVSTLAHFGCGGWLSVFTYGPMAALGIFSVWKKNKSLGILAISFYLLPLIFLTFNSHSRYIQPRYLMVIFPMHQLLAGVGVLESAQLISKWSRRIPRITLSEKRLRRLVLVAIFTFLIAMNLSALGPYYARGIKCSSENFIEQKFCREYLLYME